MWTYEKSSKWCYKWNLSQQVTAELHNLDEEDISTIGIDVTAIAYKKRAKYSSDFISAKWSCLGDQADACLQFNIDKCLAQTYI